jgi:hypothetical protein
MEEICPGGSGLLAVHLNKLFVKGDLFGRNLTVNKRNN